MAYLSIEQLGAIEGEEAREKGRLSHLTILGKIRTPRKEGEREKEEEYLGYRVATCRPSEVEIRLRPRDAHIPVRCWAKFA